MKAWLAALLALVGCAPKAVMTGGVPNLVQVSEEANVWRSGQITTAEGWATIKSLGVVRVIKLNFPSEGTDDGARLAGLDVIEVPIEPAGDLVSVFEEPDAERLAQALTALKLGSALVHCTHGQDRTGLAVGMYRVSAEHWTKRRAWTEMIQRGYHSELPALTVFWMEYEGEPR